VAAVAEAIDDDRGELAVLLASGPLRLATVGIVAAAAGTESCAGRNDARRGGSGQQLVDQEIECGGFWPTMAKAFF
jgi:hypothetical protein